MGLGLEILCLFIFFVLPRNSYFCDAQASFTSLTESNTPQAIGSDVVITAVVVTSFIPASVTWRINGVTVGSAGVNSGSTTVASEDPSTSYASRIVVSVGSFASSEFTTTLTITGLTATDNGANVVITTVGSSDASLELVVQECSLDTTAYPSLTFTCDDSPCEFNSAGTLSCAEGYTASGVSTTSTTCQADATLTNLDVLSCAASMSATTTISTDPPNNPLTTGFNNLIVTAQFPTPTDFGDSCGWLYGGELGSGNGNIYSTLGGCDPSPSNANRSITCIIDATDHIITTLTITQLLVAGNLDIDVRCTFATNTPVPVNRTVKDCPSSLSHDVNISSSPGTYQANAMFSCPPGRELYYSNSTALPSNDTTCLANAKWSGQDNLQCWSAPDVTLNGGLNIVENDNITLNCDYDDTVIPSGTSSIFYFDNVGYTLNKDDAFSLTLQKEDNMKPISCQAITPYTEVNNSTGRSLTETVNVLYLSLSVVNTIEISQYVIESSESNYLIRSDQQLTMNCIPSDANPPATCSWQLCSDSRCQTLTSSGSCLISVGLNASSNVTCAAENVVGNISSAEQTVNVVPAERQVQFNVTGSNVTNDGSINSTTYLGESIMISCSVSYENELNTAYLIKLPDNTMISQSSKLFSSVTRDDSGDYICNTTDQFGNFNAAIYLNVIYAPQEDDFTASDDCNGWYVGRSGASCSVVFYSNPSSQFVSFTKNGQPAMNDGIMTIKSDGDQQTFEFQKNEVTSSDNGTYTLTVQSTNKDTFPDNVQIIFHIIVADEPPPTPGLSLGAIIGIVCGCVVIILISVAVYVIHKRRKGSKKDGNQSDEVYPNGNGNHLESGTTGGDAVHVNLAFKGDSEKELKINPIYASGGVNYAQVDKKNKSKNTSDKGSNGNEASTSNDELGAAYAQVDVTKKKKKKGSSEKEEKMNPIYEAGDQPAPIEEAYAEVDKKKKSKKGTNEKEDRINPLYGSSESPDQVEAAYAEVDEKKKKKKKGKNEKEERINPLYGSSESPDQVEAAYAEVDIKKKNKKKKGSSEKEEKLNPLYVSSDQPEPTEAAYAEVDKNKKKKQSAKEERINPLYEASSSQDQVEAAYAEVDKSKKKRKIPAPNTTQNEPSANATYAEVNKPKKKKKPPAPSRANTTDATQVEATSNATYAEVNKPKKKKKPPPPSRQTAGGDGAYDDVDLHGSSSTKK